LKLKKNGCQKGFIGNFYNKNEIKIKKGFAYRKGSGLARYNDPCKAL